MIRNTLKTAVILTLGSTPAANLKLRLLKSRESLVILCLHRIGSDDGSTYPSLNPELFEDLLHFVAEHFEVTTFSDLGSSAPRHPQMVISFDDGYADFFETAMPLLSKYNLSANLNIIPECVESGRPPLNVELQDFIGKARKDELSALAVPGFALDHGMSRKHLGESVSNYIKRLRMHAQLQIRDTLYSVLGDSLKNYATRMMNIEQVLEAAKTHEIGAHSYSHASLAHETDEFVSRDIAACRDYFERLGLPMNIYALPNGSYRPEQLSIFERENVPVVLLVGEDFSNHHAKAHHRFTFYATSKRETIYRALGAMRWPRS